MACEPLLEFILKQMKIYIQGVNGRPTWAPHWRALGLSAHHLTSPAGRLILNWAGDSACLTGLARGSTRKTLDKKLDSEEDLNKRLLLLWLIAKMRNKCGIIKGW